MYFTIAALVFAIAAGSAAANPIEARAPAPDQQDCEGGWDFAIGGEDSAIQEWGMWANNVPHYSGDARFKNELNIHDCAVTGFGSKYFAENQTLYAHWTSSGTCTPGRVTDAISSSAGLRNVACHLAPHEGGSAGETGLTAIDAILEGVGAGFGL